MAIIQSRPLKKTALRGAVSGYGEQCKVCGVWCKVYSVWCMNYDLWLMDYGLILRVQGQVFSVSKHFFCTVEEDDVNAATQVQIPHL